MNSSTTLGIIAGCVLVGLASVMSTDNVALLWQPLSAVVVIGGTLAATLVAFPAREVLRVWKVFWIVLRNEKLYTDDDVRELTDLSRLAIKGDVRKTETAIASLKNPFLKTGAQLVLDGATTDDIIAVLSWRIEKLKAKERAEANLFHAMASFAPAFGMLGTILGLVNMLNAFGADIKSVGVNLALALVTTLYGVLAANVIFKPIAMKIEHRTQQRVELMNMILEGICLIAQRRGPTAVRETFDDMHEGFASHHRAHV